MIGNEFERLRFNALMNKKVESGLPAGYEWATDDDFSGRGVGGLKYIGTKEYIALPDRVRDTNVWSIDNMFQYNKVIKGVYYDNPMLTSAKYAFAGVTNNLDLRYLNISNVEDMRYMFYEARTNIDGLENWEWKKNCYCQWMFAYGTFSILDLSSLETIEDNCDYMFKRCSVDTIYAKNYTMQFAFEDYGEAPRSKIKIK